MTTEENNPKTRGISSKRTEDIVRIINEEDFQAFEAVKASVTEIAKAADICLSGIKKGGRVIYVGAGTTGSSINSKHAMCVHINERRHSRIVGQI